MFGAADVRRLGDNSDRPDVGRLLDAALFYGRVHISMDMSLFTGLVNVLGANDLAAILDHHVYSASMTPEIQGVMPGLSIMASYRPVSVLGQYTDQLNASSDPVDIIKRAFGDNRPIVRQLTTAEVDAVVKNVEFTKFEKLMPAKEAASIWMSLANDVETIKLALPVAAARKSLTIDEKVFQAAEFRVTSWSGGVSGWSSIPLEEIAVGKIENRLTWADVFADIDDYRIDLVMAQNSMADLILNDKSSKFALQRADVALQRAKISENNISNFKEYSLGSMGSIGEAYNAGILSIRECLKVIDDAEKFKKWIAGQSYDADLTKEYIIEISRKNFFEKWPGRELKFLGISAASLGTAALNPALGAAVGLALGAFDNYYLNEIIKGWRPNIFVSNIKDKIRK